MSAECAPSPHQTSSILIISLNGESTLHSTTVSPNCPYFFPVSLPNPAAGNNRVRSNVRHPRCVLYNSKQLGMSTQSNTTIFVIIQGVSKRSLQI